MNRNNDYNNYNYNYNYNYELCNWVLNRFKNNINNYNRELCNWDLNRNNNYNNYNREFCNWDLNRNNHYSNNNRELFDWDWNRFINNADHADSRRNHNHFVINCFVNQNDSRQRQQNLPVKRNTNTNRATTTIGEPKAAKGKQVKTVEPQQNSKSKVKKPNQVKTAPAKNLSDIVSSPALWVFPKQEPKDGKGKQAITVEPQPNPKGKSEVNKPNQVAKNAAAKILSDTVSLPALWVFPKQEPKYGKGKQAITVEPQPNPKGKSEVNKPNQVAKNAAAKILSDTVSSPALWVFPKQEPKDGKGKQAITVEPQPNPKGKSEVNKPNQVAKNAAAKILSDTVSSPALWVFPKQEPKDGKGKQALTVEPQPNPKGKSEVNKLNQVAKNAAAKILSDTVSSPALWVFPKQEPKDGKGKQALTVEPQPNLKGKSEVNKLNQVAKNAAAKILSDTITSQDLQVLAKLFRDDIEFLQQRITAEAAAAQHNTQCYEKLIIAKIFMSNGQRIAEQSFEFICSEIVGWIGKYQHEQLDTPIFYSVANNETHITIVCENMHAYECLGNCVRDIKQQRTITPITLLRLPPTLIYCYNVVYSDIISDEQLFLTQVQLHKAELQADRWIVVSHEVYSATGETHLTLLVNERSALLLTYHYNNKLYICLQTATFTNEGPLPLNV